MDDVSTNDSSRGEMVYLAAYGVIKRMLENGIITKDAFDRLNIKMAAEKSCKPIAA